jgi:hypothetical protein
MEERNPRRSAGFAFMPGKIEKGVRHGRERPSKNQVPPAERVV